MLLALFAVSAAAQSPALASDAAPSTTQQAQPEAPPQAPASSPAAQAEKAADPSAPADDPLTTIRATTNEVNVVFTVTDKHGRHVTDLKQS